MTNANTARHWSLKVVWLCLLLACLACEEGPVRAPYADLEESLRRGTGVSRQDLEAQLREGLRSGRSRATGPKEVRLAIAVGRGALALRARGGDPAVVREAAGWVGAVGQEVGLPRLCEVLLVHAQLQHAVAPSPPDDGKRLAEIAQRFRGQSVDRACVRQAERYAESWVGERAPKLPTPAAHLSRDMGRITLLSAVEVFAPDERRAAAVRLVFHFDGAVAYRKRLKANASASQGVELRVRLDGVRAAPVLPREIAVAAGGVRGLSILELSDGRDGTGGLEVVVALDSDVEHDMFMLPGPPRLVLDTRARRETMARTVPTVVIDPGHGGRNPGAKGPTGLRESDVALSLARRVRRAVARDMDSVRVALTRDADVEVSLEERAAIANGLSADLFVSLHLNASASAEDRGGVSTFVLDTTGDEQARRLAARENGTDVDAVTDLQRLLATLVRRGQVTGSKRAARAIHAATLQGARRVLPQLPDRGVKTAAFHVLVGAVMPALLLEASFISRPDEEAALRTDAYRTALAEGIAAGIVAYLTEVRAKIP